MCLVLSACSFALKILHSILGSVTAPTDSPVVFLCKISFFFLIFLNKIKLKKLPLSLAILQLISPGLIVGRFQIHPVIFFSALSFSLSPCYSVFFDSELKLHGP